MNSKKHIIIFSHGFGVRKDDRGLLSEIAQNIPEAESVLFDYYEVDEENKKLVICPFSTQVAKLNTVIQNARNANPDAIIDIVAHSQGCMIPALAKPDGVRKTILLAPSFDMSIERTLARYRARPDTEINLDGMSKLSVLDGYTRFVPAQYWIERKEVQAIDEYNTFAEKTELIAIEANQDELIPRVDLSTLNPKVILAPLDGNHGFYGDARAPLIKAIRGYLL